MAKEKAEAARAAVAEPVVEPVAVPVVEPTVYTASELAESYAAFKYPKECVVAALRCAGINRATFDQAKAEIDKFMRKVIK